MAIAKPPKQSDIDKKAEALIDKAFTDHPKDQNIEAIVTVRLPRDTVKRIDVLVKSRRCRIPRHTWFLEAVYEKLDREEKS